MPDRPDVTIEEFRAGYDRMFRDFPIDPGASITEVDAGGVRSLLVQIGGPDPERYVVYFHGGGLMCGNPEGVRGTAALLARAADAAVLVPDYRLAPEHAYPAAIDDALAATRWLLASRGVDPSRLAVLGDSAGGALAALCALRLGAEGPGAPAALVGWSPWLDWTVSGATVETKAAVDPIASGPSLLMSAAAYLQGHDAADPAVSALFADLAELPPTLLEVGSEEVLLDDSVRFAARAEAAGVEVTLEVADGLPHVYQYFASFLAEGQASIDRTGSFIVKHTA
ncbi:alpha/beta hydrolase [Sporichthya brevicatena]|uniref:Alpha/beta hydrolase n=1 Tax=Sporichthya brevicatena TaxID=171442 RepID=A0ABN1GYH5_9ACTN